MKTKLQILSGSLVAIACLFIALATSPATARAEPAAQPGCGVVLELPEGSEVRPDATGDRLLVRPPAGYVLSDVEGEPRFVAVDWDASVPYSVEMEAAVDCNCDGDGFCWEVTDGSRIWCDPKAPCTDCTMTVTPT